ncbi:hypothetical protein S40285_10393 [Stachybotrys chlorohalonatus IBT 40285]|uniref:Uncharacterized protein n=1 Tax=Stachybotrys chlorohalonatus (strain IBT 40285) TaxID=1283841 RepID=A0A084QCD0_STAC4|nr:hypothetical protein S40285_10393 [Stachybotrys chlorohalonata IBT 40285]
MDEAAARQYFLHLVSTLLGISAFAWAVWTMHRWLQTKQFEIQGEVEPNSPIGSRLESQTNLEKSVDSKRRFALDRTISASSNPSKHADSPSWSRWAKPIDVPE